MTFTEHGIETNDPLVGAIKPVEGNQKDYSYLRKRRIKGESLSLARRAGNK